MKKNTLLIALGQKPKDEEAEDEVSEDTDSEDESSEDEAIDTALDPEADPETRRAAFRRAVELCTKAGY